MKEEDALLAAVAKEPDEDLPRLAFADWLDENSPDDTPTPAEGPSAWAEFVRVQCRLAAGAFDDPDYPELLEREASLGHWLSLRLPDLEASPGFPDSNAGFGGGEWGNSRRGFPEVVFFASYTSTVAEESVEAIIGRLKEKFAESPARTVSLEDAMNDEIALLVRHPVFARVRGLFLEGLEDRNGEEALAAIAASRWSTGLRRLSIHHVQLDDPICEVLAQSPYLRNLESLTIGYPIGARSVEALGRSKWFRRLRRLNLWLGPDDGFRALAALPAMRRLISLTLGGAESTSAGVKRFAASASFPALAHLDLGETHLSTDQVVALARGRWPLRHLRLRQNEVRKAGVEALVVSPFAPTLRVLELPWCEITASGVQELAKAEALANLRHLDLAENPIGPGGLAAIAASQTHSGHPRSTSHRRTPRAGRWPRGTWCGSSGTWTPQAFGYSN
jgi:uncharacterized protein (TIGR02996 family)